jgi:hypothetical protein
MPPKPNRTAAIVLGVISLAAATGLTACVAPITVDAERAPAAVEAPSAEAAVAPQSDDKQRPAGWTEESHSNDVDPNYGIVFPVDAVNTITITFAPEDWAAMQANMEALNPDSLFMRNAILAQGAGLSVEERELLLVELMRKRAEEMRSAAEMTATSALTASEALTAEADAGLQDLMVKDSPMWVPATIAFQGQEWTHVGVRYKGVSSLNGPWVLGDPKLPFKFDFDEFEDNYPEIKNQRFFGFKELSLANNFQDLSGMRDTLVYDFLGEAGLPSLHTAPYEIVIDYGEGPLRLGLYTVVEVIDDTGVAAYFGSDDGNIYEGNDRGASFAPKYVDKLLVDLEKKNNEDEDDWSDILALYGILQDERRTSDPAAWRADLEAIFDVEVFLEWLGISAVTGNVDSYGLSPHNFYLYNDPASGRLTWFSWDHNLSFKSDMLAVFTLDKTNVTEDAPLVRYLLDDPVYWDRYVTLMAENFATVLDPEQAIAKVRTYADVIAPFAAENMSPAEYKAAVQEIVDFIEARAADTAAFLAELK